MSTSSAQKTYERASASHQAALRAVKEAERVVEESEDRLEHAAQAYLDALGAPKVGERLPFNATRVMVVAQRDLIRNPRQPQGVTWRVGGSLHEAKRGQWVQVKQFDTLSQTQVTRPSAEAWAAEVRARLEKSNAKTARTLMNRLRLGPVEIDFLRTMAFDQGASFQAPTGILFGQGGSLRGNVKLAENLHRKGVLCIPNYREAQTLSVTPDWYRQPMKKGPRAAEARLLMDQSPGTRYR